MVDRFSSPNEIEPSESVMEPSARVRLPTVEPVARVAVPLDNVPAVDRFSSPNEIEPSESVMLPVAKVKVPSMLASSFTVKSLVTVKFSD